jgi:hypothetical protein
MKNLNAWFNFIEYIQMSTNVTDLRQILLRSMTIGIAKYAFDMQDSVVSVKRTPSPPKSAVNGRSNASHRTNDQTLHAENNNNNNNDRLSIQTVTTPNSSRKNNKSTMKGSSGGVSMATTPYESLMPRRQRSIVEQLVGLTSHSQSMNEVYESLLDNLLELNEATNRHNRFNDSLTMLMVSRGGLLVDLMANLHDKFFQENMSLNLCNLINNVIIEVNDDLLDNPCTR